MIIMWILNPENYCIPSRNRLLGQTTKQPFSNFEIQKPCNYKQPNQRILFNVDFF